MYDPDLLPLRTYDFTLTLRGDLAARRALILDADERIVGVLSPWATGRAKGPLAQGAASQPGTWFLSVAKGAEPEMLVAAVDAWDELVRCEEAERFNDKRKTAKKSGKKK
jgi:hypothetical protein